MRISSSGQSSSAHEEDECLNSELWHACAGPLVSLPAVGSRVVYLPQGHSEQVAASTNKEIDGQIPNYPSLPPQLICQLHNVTMHADAETDEVYAQMTLQPLSPQGQKDPYLPTELGSASKQPTNYFCKILTASDTSTHGGFSVPRRAAEKVFPPLDFSQQPPAQELIARDLHGNEWKFRHVFRGQPKRHLLTTGWSVFVSAKRLIAGDSVLFIWNENNQLLLGIRRANRPQTVMPSSVLSSDSMHIGLLAAAAHAAATNSRFTIFYNPRASPSEFVIPLAKYVKAVCHNHISVGMRFRMLFETEESSIRRYMGTITGISDLDPVRWPNSHWRSVKVGWDESTTGDKQPRVSLWEIEPLTPFSMYPSPFPMRLKRPWPTGLPFLQCGKSDDMGLDSPIMWFGNGAAQSIQSLNFQGIGVAPWLQPRIDTSLLGLQADLYQAMAAAAFQDMSTLNSAKQEPPDMLQFQQGQNTVSMSASILPSHIQQSLKPQSQQAGLQTVEGSQGQLQNESQLVHNCLQMRHSIGKQQQQQQQEQIKPHLQVTPQQPQIQATQYQQVQQQKLPSTYHQVSNVMPNQSQGTSSSSQSITLQTVSSYSQPQNIRNSNVNVVSTSSSSPLHTILNQFSQKETSNLLSLPRTAPLPTSNPWSSKRVAVESVLPSGAHSLLSQELGSAQTNIAQESIILLPFPGRECSVGRVASTDPENHLLYGVNVDSAPRLETVSSEANSTSMPYAACNFLSSLETFPLNQELDASGFFDDSGYNLRSPATANQANPPSGVFVKVSKLGSFGRSLDITRFSSYHELRSELGRLFGLEGQLEDPLRSGWQLVFVDRENDILLVGDDPWQEFVNNVSCIKILSPQEVQMMGKQGVEFLNSTHMKRLPSNSCDDYVSQQEPRNLGGRITSVGVLKY